MFKVTKLIKPQNDSWWRLEKPKQVKLREIEIKCHKQQIEKRETKLHVHLKERFWPKCNVIKMAMIKII